MRAFAALASGFLVVALVAAGLLWWVRSGGDSEPESGIEITYVETPEPSRLFDMTVVARRPGGLLEFASLGTLEGDTLDVDRQEPAIPGFPDIAATQFGLVIVDGGQGVLYDQQVSTPTAPADALVGAGGPWVWHIRDVGDGSLEVVLFDVIGGVASGDPLLLDRDEVRAAPGLGLLVGDKVLGPEEWDVGGAEILVGGAAGVLIREGGDFYTIESGGAEPVAVTVPRGLDDVTFAAPSPGFTHVVAIDGEDGRLIDLTSGEAVAFAPAVGNLLRYGWLPDGSAVVWMEEGHVYMLEVGASEAEDLGAATVAFSYGNLEILEVG